ncbi:MAG: N-acetylmuramoyl-L-alanine amidase [Pseudomonadota bacterium]
MADPVDHSEARLHGSDNCDPRPPGTAVDAVVIHYTALPLAESLELLARPGHPASTHYVIDRDGTLYQLVPERFRAWHAGVSRLGDRVRVNDFSVGIDLVFEPDIDEGYTEPQYTVLLDLLDGLRTRHRIPTHRVVGHDDVALPPGRKEDPGPRFDWPRVRQHLSELD